MDKNQKIALGCGGAGCVGLILVVVVCVILGAAGYIAMPGRSSNRNYNANTNSNYNSNLSNSNSNSGNSSSAYSDDDKHKLMQAGAISQDRALMERVMRKLGFLIGTNSVSDDYADFMKSHLSWAKKNRSFILSVNTPEKARAYVEEHLTTN